jgi:hypothetical protein
MTGHVCTPLCGALHGLPFKTTTTFEWQVVTGIGRGLSEAFGLEFVEVTNIGSPITSTGGAMLDTDQRYIAWARDNA